MLQMSVTREQRDGSGGGGLGGQDHAPPLFSGTQNFIKREKNVACTLANTLRFSS